MAENKDPSAKKRRGAGKPFAPGVSGNPGGRPKILAEVKELARKHAPEAIIELARLAKEAVSEPARVAAIREILDRAYGKPVQAVEASGPDGGPMEFRETLGDMSQLSPSDRAALRKIFGKVVLGE